MDVSVNLGSQGSGVGRGRIDTERDRMIHDLMDVSVNLGSQGSGVGRGRIDTEIDRMIHDLMDVSANKLQTHTTLSY